MGRPRKLENLFNPILAPAGNRSLGATQVAPAISQPDHIINKAQSMRDDQVVTGMPRSWELTLIDPSALYDTDAQVFVAWAFRRLEITSIQIELDTSSYDVTGDLKQADDFQALGSPSVINDFDTTSGKRTDSSISSGVVNQGKAIYLQFDAGPNAAIKQMHVRIGWKYLRG